MKANKYFTVLLGCFLFSSVILGVIFKKYVFLFFHHSVYLCQQVISSWSLRFPGNLGKAVPLIFLAMLLYLAIKLVMTWIKVLKMKRFLSFSIVHSDMVKKLAEKLELRNKLFVYRNTCPDAFCFGFINPKIYISTGLVGILSEIELEAVVRHEKHHLENKDALTHIFASVTRTLFPFFPVISDISNRYRVQNEIEADEAAIKGMKSSASLVSVLRKLVSFDHKNTFDFGPSLGDWDTLETRIKRLVNHKIERQRSSMANVAISLISLVMLMTLSLSQVSAIEYHDSEGDIIFLCPQIPASFY